MVILQSHRTQNMVLRCYPRLAEHLINIPTYWFCSSRSQIVVDFLVVNCALEKCVYGLAGDSLYNLNGVE